LLSFNQNKIFLLYKFRLKGMQPLRNLVMTNGGNNLSPCLKGRIPLRGRGALLKGREPFRQLLNLAQLPQRN